MFAFARQQRQCATTVNRHSSDHTADPRTVYPALTMRSLPNLTWEALRRCSCAFTFAMRIAAQTFSAWVLLPGFGPVVPYPYPEVRVHRATHQRRVRGVCMRRCIHTFQMGPRPGAPQLPRSQEPPLRRPCSAALDPGFQLPARGGSRCRCRPRGRAALGRGGGGCPGTRHGPTASRLAPLPPRRCSRGLTWMVCLLYTFTT